MQLYLLLNRKKMVELIEKQKETDIKCKIDINGCGKSILKLVLDFWPYVRGFIKT